MNFTSTIKQEIIQRKMNKEEMKAFLWGVFCSNIQDNENKIKIKFINTEILNSFLQIVQKVGFGFQVQNKCFIFDSNDFENIKPKFANIYLSGIFLTSGSISNLTSSSYHLEICFKSEKMCDQIMEFAKKHLIFNKIKNKNNWMLYIKKNEAIADFLQIIGAQESYFNFIDSIIQRDLKNQITRIFNLDLHNQNKLVNSNQSFLENLQYIKDNNLEYKFTKEQLIFYEFKKENQFSPLSQLSQELNQKNKINISKSGLNHWLIKLRNVCDEERNKK